MRASRTAHRRRDAARRSAGWRLEWGPFLVLGALFVTGAAVTLLGFAWLSPETMNLGNLFLSLLGWAIFFWLLLYALVEYRLWRWTRNVGHRLQFLGALLLVGGPLFFWIPLTAGGFPGVFTPAGLVGALLFQVAFWSGIVLALVGYYHPVFRARDVDLYRNVVVREGEQVAELTNGYSTRMFATRHDALAGMDLGAATSWATLLGKAGVLLGQRPSEGAITVYPVTYTGAGTFRLWTVLTHLLWLSRHPERLTWVRLARDGSVGVHLSPYDYARIRRPVAYDRLCAAVGDAAVSSLLAFRRGDAMTAVAAMEGERAPAPSPRPLPTRTLDRVGLAAAVFATLVLLGGLSSAFVATLTSARGPIAIADLQYPAFAAPGEAIEVHARLSGVDPFWDLIGYFDLAYFAYFNTTRDGTLLSMRHLEGDEYAARLGAFPDGTEIAFFLTASVRTLGMTSGQDLTLTSGPHTIQVGRVPRGGPSGLVLGAVTYTIGPGGNVTFHVSIASAAAVDYARLLVQFSYGYGFWFNLTSTGGGNYEALVEGLVPFNGTGSTSIHYRIVARDVTWNTAATGLVPLEVKP